MKVLHLRQKNVIRIAGIVVLAVLGLWMLSSSRQQEVPSQHDSKPVAVGGGDNADYRRAYRLFDARQISPRCLFAWFCFVGFWVLARLANKIKTRKGHDGKRALTEPTPPCLHPPTTFFLVL